eukprot:m.93271 g.93271  ORF g.93271 m.93271 type:complete len:52 (+) comp20285_c2_seq3:969-1124(+)
MGWRVAIVLLSDLFVDFSGRREWGCQAVAMEESTRCESTSHPRSHKDTEKW